MKTEIAAALAFVALPSTAVAQAKAQACLTHAEGSAAIVFVLPTALTATADRCAPLLGATSYLARSGTALRTRYQAEADRDSAAGRAALVKMIGPLQGMKVSDATVADLVGAGIRQPIGQMKLKDCRQVDEVLALIEPLPAANVAQLVVRLLDNGKPSVNAPFRFCSRA